MYIKCIYKNTHKTILLLIGMSDTLTWFLDTWTLYRELGMRDLSVDYGVFWILLSHIIIWSDKSNVKKNCIFFHCVFLCRT